jgi:hypothetical protein
MLDFEVSKVEMGSWFIFADILVIGWGCFKGKFSNWIRNGWQRFGL